MPTINGITYPELNVHPASNPIFRVMLMTTEAEYLYKLMEQLNVLRHYLGDIGAEFDIEVRAFSTGLLEANKEKYGYQTFTGIEQSKDEILSYAQSNNIDLIYSDDKDLITELYKTGKPFQYAETISQLENEIESYVTGKNVPWNFNQPVWNATWFSKHIEDISLVGNLRDLNNIASSQLGYTDKQTSFVRALQHKAMQIKHCEENLLGLVQRKNYSERNYAIKDSYNYDSFYDYSFELNYHLGNLYFLMSGTFDIIGRLLMDLYSISGKDVKPNIEHANFLKQLKSKNDQLYSLYSSAEMNKWMVWIKRKRNYVAHEAEASYTNVIKEKKNKLSDEEVEKKVNAMQKWDAFRMLMGDQYVESQKEMGRFVVRMHEDHKIVTKNAMEIKYYDHENREEAMALFHPLVDIKADYDKFRKLLDSTAKTLLDGDKK